MTHVENRIREYVHRVRMNMYDRGYTQKDMAALLGISDRAFGSKIRMVNSFTQPEMIRIQDTFRWKTLEGRNENDNP